MKDYRCAYCDEMKSKYNIRWLPLYSEHYEKLVTMGMCRNCAKIVRGALDKITIEKIVDNNPKVFMRCADKLK